jgi:hypothetical protein
MHMLTKAEFFGNNLSLIAYSIKIKSFLYLMKKKQRHDKT